MSLLQRIDAYQKIDPAFVASGVMTSDVSEVTETDEDVLILNGPGNSRKGDLSNV